MNKQLIVGLCLSSSALLLAPACSDDGGTDSDATETTGDGDGDPSGDGDGDPSGDGDGDPSGDGDGDPSGDGDGDPAGDPLDEMVEFLGGEDALLAMSSFRVTASGTRSIANEGENAGDVIETGTFDAISSVDLANNAARVDYERVIGFLGGLPMSYAEIYNGDLGYISGDDAVLVPGPTDAPMLSSRWASGRLQLAYLNPHLIVREVLAGDREASPADADIEGCDATIEVADPISPIYLCLLEGGELTGLYTLTNDFLLRDVELHVSYAGWQGDGVQFPTDVELSVDGDPYQTETRSVEVDVALDAALFELPDGGMFDMQLAGFGAISHQFFQSFSALGIPLDFPLLFVSATELAPGVHHLTGGSHHSLVVEQDSRVIVIEAPNYPERADAILAWISENIPNKPVTHVVATHHHEDHTSGLRSFVAVGATVVLHEASEDYFAQRVFTAPSTLSPDTLSNANVEPVMLGVAGGGEVLDDGANPVTLSQMVNPHSGDMLYIHVDAGGGIAFNSDLYNPGNGGSSFNPASAQALLDAINDGPETGSIAGGHGGVAPVSELEDFVAP